MYDTGGARLGGARRNDEMIQLSASSTSSIQPKRSQGGRFLGASGACPSTFQGGTGGSLLRCGGVTRVRGPVFSGPALLMSRSYSAPGPMDEKVIHNAIYCSF